MKLIYCKIIFLSIFFYHCTPSTSKQELTEPTTKQKQVADPAVENKTSPSAILTIQKPEKEAVLIMQEKCHGSYEVISVKEDRLSGTEIGLGVSLVDRRKVKPEKITRYRCIPKAL